MSPRPRNMGWRLVGSWACLIAAATAAIATAPPRPASPNPAEHRGLAAAARCARTFTEDYLAWMARGRSTLRSASAALRRRLAAEALPPRRGAQRRLRIAELHTELRPGGTTATATARVLDAAGGSFELTLTLDLREPGWEVRDAIV